MNRPPRLKSVVTSRALIIASSGVASHASSASRYVATRGACSKRLPSALTHPLPATSPSRRRLQARRRFSASADRGNCLFVSRCRLVLSTRGCRKWAMCRRGSLARSSPADQPHYEDSATSHTSARMPRARVPLPRPSSALVPSALARAIGPKARMNALVALGPSPRALAESETVQRRVASSAVAIFLAHTVGIVLDTVYGLP